MKPVLSQEDLARIPDHLWEPESVSTDGLRHTFVHYDMASGQAYRKTTNVVEDTLLKVIHEERAINDGVKWGDGKVAMRLPLNLYYKHMAKRRREGDQDFAKWLLNNPDFAAFRTKSGRV